MGSGNQLQILVCEDDIGVAQLHHANLEKLLKSPKINIVTDGLQGKFKVLLDRYDLVLSDLNMPGINGLELFRFTRLAGFYVPFILCTSMNTDLAQIQNKHDFYFLRKPYLIKELQHALKYLLPRHIL